MYVPQFIYPFICWWDVGCFYLLVEWASNVTILQWTLACNYMFDSPVSILWDIYIAVKLLEHMVILCLIFWGPAKPFFHSIQTILHSQKQWTRGPISLHSHRHLWFFHNSHPHGCEVVSHCVQCIFSLLSVNRSSPRVDFYNYL